MDLINGVKKAGRTALYVAWQIGKAGSWGLLNQWTNQQYKDTSTKFIREVQQGAEHQAKKFKLLKND